MSETPSNPSLSWRALLCWGPPLRRLLLFLASGVLAVQLGFVWVTPKQAEGLIVGFGYPYIAGVFCLFLYFAHRLLWQERRGLYERLRREGPTLALIAVSTLFVLLSDPVKHKVLFDEYVLQSTARHLHETKEVGAVFRAYPIEGSFIAIDTFLDKRPYFLTFLVSLVHDLTGYRSSNFFWVNAACVPLLLGLCYYLGASLGGRRAGQYGVLLLATLPLLWQTATGAGMEIHNLSFLALCFSLAIEYLRKPDETRLSLLCLAAVLLSQSRYESALFAAPVATVVLLGWLRVGRLLIPPTLLATPLLFVPFAWHNRVLSATPLLWQLQEGQSSRFSVEYLPSNLEGCWSFFFSFKGDLANSWYLSALGWVGIVYALFCALRWARRRERPEPGPAQCALLAFGLGIGGHLGLLQFYYWARLDDVIASRFSLPSYLLLTLCAVQMLASAARVWGGTWKLAGWLLGGYLALGVFVVRPHKLYTSQNVGALEVEWELEQVEQRPRVPRLLLANKSTMPWLLHDTPALILGVARHRLEQIRYHMEQGTFQEVLVSQSIRPTSPEGDMGVEPADLLPPRVKLERLAEKRFGGRIDRLSRVLAIDPEKPQECRPLTASEGAGNELRGGAPTGVSGERLF